MKRGGKKTRGPLYLNFSHNSPRLRDNSLLKAPMAICFVFFHMSLPLTLSACDTGQLETPRQLAEVILAASADALGNGSMIAQSKHNAE